MVGCMVVCLHAYLVAWLLSCLVTRLLGYMVALLLFL